MNTFPKEGNSSPSPRNLPIPPYTSLAHLQSTRSLSYSYSRTRHFHLLLGHRSQSFASSYLCSSIFTLSVSHFSHLPTAIHQLFAISIPLFPLFIISSIKSIYNAGSLNNCCAIKTFNHGNYDSYPAEVSAVCPVLLHGEQYQHGVCNVRAWC